MSGVPSVRKVLVVDDDPVIGKSFQRVLSGKGYAVITAADGEEALKKLSAEAYDVVFADIRMPGISGIEVARQLKKSQPWLPVVIVTGYGTQENETRAEAVGVSGFLRKPLSPAMIENAAKITLATTSGSAEATPNVADAAVELETSDTPKAGIASRMKDIALFFAAPFVGLAYFLTLPFVGLGILLWFAARAIAEAKPSVAKSIALGLAVPVIGLAFIIIGPIVGLGALAWLGVKATIKFIANAFGNKSGS